MVDLANGDRGFYDNAVPAFAVMGKKSHFLGTVGQGARMKLVVNLIMGGMMAAFVRAWPWAGRRTSKAGTSSKSSMRVRSQIQCSKKGGSRAAVLAEEDFAAFFEIVK